MGIYCLRTIFLFVVVILYFIAEGCAEIEEVQNGGYKVVAGKNFTGTAQFNDVVEFYCDDGYELTGPLRSICNTGVWTHEGTLPSCVGKITQYLLS